MQCAGRDGGGDRKAKQSKAKQSKAKQSKAKQSKAKKVKERYPEAFRAYKQWERERGLALGSVSFAQVGPRLWIANVVTQERMYGAKGERLVDLEAVEAGFAAVGKKARELGLGVEVPLVGCGLAGGAWSDVLPRVLAGLGEGARCRVWGFAPPQPVPGGCSRPSPLLR